MASRYEAREFFRRMENSDYTELYLGGLLSNVYSVFLSKRIDSFATQCKHQQIYEVKILSLYARLITIQASSNADIPSQISYCST